MTYCTFKNLRAVLKKWFLYVSRHLSKHFVTVVQPTSGKRDKQFQHAIPIEMQVAVAMWRLATGNFFRTVAKMVCFDSFANFSSCCAGSALLKYNGCGGWICVMNPCDICCVHQQLGLLKLGNTTFFQTRLLRNKKKHFEQHFEFFFYILSTVFIRRYS